MPFVRISLFFICGILIADHFRYDLDQCLLAQASLLFAVFFSHFFIREHKRLIHTIIIFTAAFLVGLIQFTLAKPENQRHHYSAIENIDFIKGIVLSQSEKAKSIKVELEVDSVFSLDGLGVGANGKLICYLRKPINENIGVGDILKFPFDPMDMKSNSNPHTFDYKQYLYYQGVIHQCFVNKDWEIENTERESRIEIIRAHFLNTIDTYINGLENKAIIKAISLGSKEDITDELRKKFEDTGAIHVLAISGLHVGIIASIFLLLLNSRWANANTIRLIIILIALFLIWIFVLLTGASPSVQRAALMFSFFILTKIITRQVNIFNTIAASAFFILLFNPFMLFQISFQFSYLAVLSIVYFYPKIRPYFPRPKFLSYFIDIWLVSICAQIFITPLSIYYFQKISLISSVSSLIAIPVIAASMLTVFVLIISSMYFPFLSRSIAQLLEVVLDFLRESLGIMQSWSFAYLDQIYLSAFSVSFAYAFIVSACLLIEKLRGGVYLFLISVIICMSLNLSRSNFSRETELFVYDHQKVVLIDVISNGHCLTYCSGKLTQEDIDHLASPNRTANGVHNIISMDSLLHGSGILDLQLGTKKVSFVLNHDFVGAEDEDIIFLLGDTSHDQTENFSGKLIWEESDLESMGFVKINGYE